MDREISLQPMTPEMYHAYFKEYQHDLDLFMDPNSYTVYHYHEEQVDRYIQRQIDLKRKAFAIMYGDEMVGELIIKNIEDHRCATMGIAMKNTPVSRIVYASRVYFPLLYGSIVSHSRTRYKSPLVLTLTLLSAYVTRRAVIKRLRFSNSLP